MDILTFSLAAFCLVLIIALALMFHYANRKCRHNWSKVGENNLQYCDFCGVASAPMDDSYKGQCVHKWETHNTSPITTTGSSGSDRTIGMLYILKCSKCGDMTKRQMNICDD